MKKKGDEIIFERQTAIRKKKKISCIIRRKNDFLGREGEIIGFVLFYLPTATGHPP